MHIFNEIRVSAYCIRFGVCKMEKRLPRQDQEDPATVDFRLLALHASRGCAKIAGPGFEPGSFPASQPKLCARPLGQAGAAGCGGLLVFHKFGHQRQNTKSVPNQPSHGSLAGQAACCPAGPPWPAWLGPACSAGPRQASQGGPTGQPTTLTSQPSCLPPLLGGGAFGGASTH